MDWIRFDQVRFDPVRGKAEDLIKIRTGLEI